jgi:uncharacterized protein DUF2188
MRKLRRYTVTKNKTGSGWVLKDDKTNRVKHTFRTKGNAKKGGAVKALIGPQGGSVRFEKEHGGFDEERTYPRRRDPKSSPG